MVNYKSGFGNYKGSAGTQVVAKTADIVINSDITINDDPDLKIDLLPNKRYYGTMILRLIFPSNADLDVSFKVISGTVYANFGLDMISAVSATSFGTELLIPTDGAFQVVKLYIALLTGSGGGTLQFQWAQNVSQAGDSTLFQGSSLVLFKA